jgi:hypothetical protein
MYCSVYMLDSCVQCIGACIQNVCVCVYVQPLEHACIHVAMCVHFCRPLYACKHRVGMYVCMDRDRDVCR